MARVCQICEQQEAKYKCPSCRAPYCSAACYKTHKETPCGATASVATEHAPPPSAPPLSASPAVPAPTPKEEEEDESVDPSQLLSADQLALLRSSSFVRQHLNNRAVRELITQVDGSDNRMKSLEKALLDPAFANFMYKALDEVENGSA
ncbi:hypothetical protein Poli38472_001547 [Pythium oligandrum]|uniref:HIT-type domain-containing protein n=1 Tax=Pythium oligandrum TaxID=41045 RepID=A0A8K1FNH4_PYTOL|nr:hypothetical protein Poli38472_001547 [Pythium oligandrum]|eukprot:TMW69391.1 hypothetical protein Poli38472_001547 [Pythium oligandrum]